MSYAETLADMDTVTEWIRDAAAREDPADYNAGVILHTELYCRYFHMPMPRYVNGYGGAIVETQP